MMVIFGTNFLVPRVAFAVVRPGISIRLSNTQKGRHWFSEDTFLALMRLRGVECAYQVCRAFIVAR